MRNLKELGFRVGPSSLGFNCLFSSLEGFKVENIERVNDRYQCTRIGVGRFLCGPKIDKCKSGGQKRIQ